MRRDDPGTVLDLSDSGSIDVQTLLHLQRTLGNQAVAELLARQRRQAPVAQRQTRAGPAADPKFQALTRDIRGKQRLLHAPTTGRAAAGGAQAAAVAPPDDKEAQAKTAQSGKMAAAKPGTFDKTAFIAAVDQAIAAQAPKTLDDADKFASSGKADQIKGAVQGHVTEGKKATAGPVTDATKAAPDLSVAKDKPVTPLSSDQPPGTPAVPNPSQAVPDRAPASATDFSAGPRQVNDQMAQAELTEEQLKKGNEPEFDAALGQKKELEEHSAIAPGQVRASEARTLEATKAEAATTGAAAMSTMAAHRVQAGQRVGEGQQTTKGSDESKRAQVTATLQKVFDATKRDVEEILSGLDHKVDQQFEAEEGAARKAFEADMQKRMDDYKSRRYGGFTGKLAWVRDQFLGLPPEANQIFVAARDGYVASMRQVISRIADTIGTELTRAKARIAQGRAELEAEVHKLPADLQALGEQAATGFDSQFDELNANVDAKGQELVQTLASKYTEALKAVDAEIDAEKAKNQGLVDKAIGAVKGVIDTIIQLKNLLLGVLAKAAQAIGAILKDPIGFLGHLVSAVGAGLKAFIANIADHLKKGLVSWLMGAAAQAGIQLPDRFDLKGIVQLIASLLGLTWSAIRGRIVSRGVPDQAITAAEQAVPEAQLLAREGLPGLWQQIVNKIGDLKAMILGRLTEFLIPTVLIAGITWIISLLNPASAFVKAVKAIIDIVTFIFERGAQILEFVNSVLDAIIAIAAGGAGGVPALVENALAKSIPVLIGFLAALLGVGGLADKVKSVIQAIARPVNKVVDWVVDKIVGVAKKFWAKLKEKFGRKGKSGHEPDPNETEEAKQSRLDRTLTTLRPQVEGTLAQGVTGRELQGRITSWTREHKLTSMEVEQSGTSVELWATINPRAPAGRGVELDPVETRRIVNHVVSEVLKNRDIKRRYRSMKDRLAAGTNLELSEGPDYAAASAAQRRAGGSMRWWSSLTHETGETPDQVTERKWPGKTNAKVEDVGTYPEIATEIAGSGLTDIQMATEMRSYVKTGRVSATVTPDQRQLIANVAYLMVVREGARNRRSLAHFAMTLDMVEQNHWTWHDAMAAYDPTANSPGRPGGGGAYPMSMGGAAGATRGLAASDAGMRVPGGQAEADRQELELRETDIAEQWVTNKLQSEGGIVALNPNAIVERIRRLLLNLFTT